jgi:hypothetical protein
MFVEYLVLYSKYRINPISDQGFSNAVKGRKCVAVFLVSQWEIPLEGVYLETVHL